MVVSLVYRAFVAILALVARGWRERVAREAELVVVTKSLCCGERAARPMAVRPRLPRGACPVKSGGGGGSGLIVSPETLVRWQRDFVRRRWT